MVHFTRVLVHVHISSSTTHDAASLLWLTALTRRRWLTIEVTVISVVAAASPDEVVLLRLLVTTSS